MKSFDIPILLICFKRYEKTLEIFNSIKSIYPKKLYVAIDGPRNDIEKLEVDKVASIFENVVDWDCDLHIRRSETNQGCKYGVFNAVSWFFDNEEMGIILEDDILPYPQFYQYCEELLKKYKDDKRIGCISGWSYFYNNPPKEYNYTYYFSHIQSSWGWATWKDRLDVFDLEMKNTSFNEIEKNLTNDRVPVEIINYYRMIYTHKLSFDSTWDYQFLLSLMANKMYCIQPIKRFVSSLGNADGTHPTNVDHNKSERIEDDFKMVHPTHFEYIPQLDIERNNQTREILY